MANGDFLGRFDFTGLPASPGFLSPPVSSRANMALQRSPFPAPVTINQVQGQRSAAGQPNFLRTPSPASAPPAPTPIPTQMGVQPTTPQPPQPRQFTEGFQGIGPGRRWQNDSLRIDDVRRHLDLLSERVLSRVHRRPGFPAQRLPNGLGSCSAGDA